jgi:hypothetical protein
MGDNTGVNLMGVSGRLGINLIIIQVLDTQLRAYSFEPRDACVTNRTTIFCRMEFH